MVQEQLAFLAKYPAGIYRKAFLCTLDGEHLHSDDLERFETDLERFSSNPERGYIQTSQQFFERWLNGRRGEEPKLNQYHPGASFELQMPMVRTERFDNGTIFGKIEGLVLASDFGYTSDFMDRLVFAINDISTQRVLVYKDEDEKMKLPIAAELRGISLKLVKS